MKNCLRLFLYGLFCISFCVSCSQTSSSGKSDLTVSESDHDYKIIADYPERDTRKVQAYMNEKIGNKNHISFINAHIDAQLTLDDGTRFYIKQKPGYLSIKLDKDENSPASLQEIKSLGEGLKPLLQ